MPDFRIVNCEHCGTEGRIYCGLYEDERDCGPCPICNGECSIAVEVEPIEMEDLEDAPWPAQMPRCMMPDGGECCPEYHDLCKENQQLRNLLEAQREENQRLRAHIDTIASEERAQFSDDDGPLSPEDQAAIDAAWARHRAVIGRDGMAEWRKRKGQK